MKFLVLFLAVVALAYGEVEVPDNHSAYGYLGRSVDLAKAREDFENQQQRIVGGLPAALGQYPYQAGLLIDIVGLQGRGICGASLITSDRLIGAAHCWHDGVHQAWRYEVVLGSVLLFNSGERQFTSAVLQHPDWFPLLVRNDVNIIFLAQPVVFSNIIAPIALPSGTEINEDFAGSAAIASGFGLTQDGGSISVNQYLSHVRLNVISNSVCRFGFPLVLQDSNICTSGIGQVGTCQGDSGGPLVVTRNNRNILVGVTSFGIALGCQVNFPAAYARVTSFMPFFVQHGLA